MRKIPLWIFEVKNVIEIKIYTFIFIVDPCFAEVNSCNIVLNNAKITFIVLQLMLRLLFCFYIFFIDLEKINELQTQLRKGFIAAASEIYGLRHQQRYVVLKIR